MFLQELDHASFSPHTKHLKHCFFGVDHEGTDVAVGVERAQAELANALLFKSTKSPTTSSIFAASKPAL